MNDTESAKLAERIQLLLERHRIADQAAAEMFQAFLEIEGRLDLKTGDHDRFFATFMEIFNARERWPVLADRPLCAK